MFCAGQYISLCISQSGAGKPFAAIDMAFPREDYQGLIPLDWSIYATAHLC
jgi:hypothetical protein